MRNGDLPLLNFIKDKLETFREGTPLPGIEPISNLNCLILQIIDSVRRIKYVTTIRENDISGVYCDATKSFFDPLKASVWHIRNNNLDEAFWLVFLSTHFGKNKNTGWNLVKGVYGAMHTPVYWNWERIQDNFSNFQVWLFAHQDALKATGSFGNHRKYQSIDAYKSTGTGVAIGSYIDWISEYQNHQGLIDDMLENGISEPKEAFNYLYSQLNRVVSFGRTAKFDFLTMIGKLKLINIEPDSTYMTGATGPKSGARLLFGGSKEAPINQTDLETLLNKLEVHLNLYFGMQVLEDALCNWQKSPSNYLYFNG